MFTKKDLRQTLKQKRKTLKSLVLDQQINFILAQTLETKIFDTILFYYPIKHEVNILPTIKDQLLTKRCLLPRVVGDRLEVSQITDFKGDLKNGAYGVLEPTGPRYLGPIDIAIVPGLGYNQQRHRIGYGGGYYDRFLANYKGFSMGCFYHKLNCDIKVESHDIPLDIIITEKGLF